MFIHILILFSGVPYKLLLDIIFCILLVAPNLKFIFEF